jgi:hypothetical protein
MQPIVVNESLRRRDVVVARVQSQLLISSIDFSQSIGPRNMDKIRAPVFANAYFVARTALAEIVALGGTPATILVGNTSAQDKDAVTEGLDLALSEIDISTEIQFSHENYNETNESAISVTCIATMAEHAIRIFTSSRPAFVYYSNLTLPPILDPNEFHRKWPLTELLTILRHPQTLEIIPGGSRGVMVDIERLCADHQLVFRPSLAAASMAKSLSERAGPGCKFLIITNAQVERPSYELIGQFTAAVVSEEDHRRA